MKKLPIWIITSVLFLGALMAWAGWVERHEVGYLPLALGIVFMLFAMASAPRVFADD